MGMLLSPHATRESLQRHDPFWTGKILIRLVTTVLSLLGIVSISLILSLCASHRGDVDVVIGTQTWVSWSGSLFGLALVFVFNLTTFLVQVRTQCPLHPGFVTAIELLLWTVTLSFGLFVVFGKNVEVISRLQDNAFVLEQIGLIAVFLCCVLHFVFFVFAIVDTYSRKRTRAETAFHQLEAEHRARERELARKERIARGKRTISNASSSTGGGCRTCSHCSAPLELVPYAELGHGHHPIELGAEHGNAVEMSTRRETERADAEVATEGAGAIGAAVTTSEPDLEPPMPASRRASRATAHDSAVSAYSVQSTDEGAVLSPAIPEAARLPTPERSCDSPTMGTAFAVGVVLPPSPSRRHSSRRKGKGRARSASNADPALFSASPSPPPTSPPPPPPPMSPTGTRETERAKGLTELSLRDKNGKPFLLVPPSAALAGPAPSSSSPSSSLSSTPTPIRESAIPEPLAIPAARGEDMV